jgi:hypothetical protein
MAEIFGAVASGAGLVSLSMQLLDSAQKLKGFYDTSKDAPDTVARLCFDLETMALALRQFEQYRQNDVVGSELLGRCIKACDQAVAKIKAAVEKVDRLLSKARFAGKVYMGFKEPEVRRLLEEMEHAKSSMLLAYTSYCQYVPAPKTVHIPLTDSKIVEYARVRKARRLVRTSKPETGEAASQCRVRKYSVDPTSNGFCNSDNGLANCILAANELENQYSIQSISTQT